MPRPTNSKSAPPRAPQLLFPGARRDRFISPPQKNSARTKFSISEKSAQRFTVNLFDPLESDIRPPQENSLQIGQLTVPAKSGYASARRETWKWLLAAALVVLLAEWYIYNRRVYV